MTCTLNAEQKFAENQHDNMKISSTDTHAHGFEWYQLHMQTSKHSQQCTQSTLYVNSVQNYVYYNSMFVSFELA